MIVVGDTSGLVAALNPKNSEHTQARTALQNAGVTVVSPLVILEIEHVLTRNANRRAAYSANDWLLRSEEMLRIIVPEVTTGTLRRARTIQNQYADLELDLTDAVNVVLAEAFETDILLTLDRRDFRVVRPLTQHQAFRLFPDDS